MCIRDRDYTGKGQNKPRGSEGTPSDAWSTRKLHRMGMAVRNSFEDAMILREVHRCVNEKAGIIREIPAHRLQDFRRDAIRFLEVTRGLADCTWELKHHAWLSRRDRRGWGEQDQCSEAGKVVCGDA